ncbi:MAG: hypothetical protein E2O53_09610 [Gammaproteobacteria bacterium]|nr:MAG: hypothetical protein E2O53_09610 [Gammaproteobacteria bacterium]
MRTGNGQNFVEGLTAGVLGSIVGASALLYILSRNELVSFSPERIPDLGDWLKWAYTNLGLSIPVFAILLLVFFASLRRLRSHLENDRPIDEVVQLDHLTEMWTTLFFGTGVIWTAIGMRSALIFALGDPDSTIQQGAFAVLQRMVDGGILLALSTTIFGGVGGYLMRVFKSISLGASLQHYYDRAARVDTSVMRESLQRIEQHLVDQDSTKARDEAQ